MHILLLLPLTYLVLDIFCGKLIFKFNLNMKVPELLLLRLRVVAELVVAGTVSGLCWYFPFTC